MTTAEDQPGPTVAREAITAVHVVIPAHNEEARIGACLESVHRAIAHLGRVDRTIRVDVTVVLDACTDDTVAIVGEHGVSIVEVEVRCVGAARHAGALGAAPDPRDSARGVLLVNLDADCRVPEDWLVEHLELASAHDLVLGEVEPDAGELSAAMLEAWWQRHPRGRGSLHGANLAVRLDAYLRVGGFPPVHEKEDVLLVRALRADGARVVGGTRVITSARQVGRVPGGFAGYLRTLGEEIAASPGG